MQAQMASGALSMSDVNANRTAFRNAIGSMREYGVQSVRAQSATSALTESIIKQDLGFRKSIQVRRQFNSILREQYQLQRMMAVQWTQNAAGTASADLIIPRGVNSRVEQMTGSLRGNATAMRSSIGNSVAFGEALQVMRMRVGLASAALAAGSESMIKWGKNTQWAGRQLMVGFTVPLMAFGAVAGMAAYQVDKELTRIQKVYDTTARTAAGKAQELERLRTDSMQMGTQVAKRYGVALKETLAVEAELAATGLQGQDLIQGTSEVMRAATLGEMDYQETVKATVALQSVYGYSTNELADAFNYLNATENATSLSMKDMIEAIPRASGPLSALGVTLQDTGVLMAAMKSRGVDAAQGANALKSGLNRVLNPSKKVQEQMREVGIDIDKIVNESGGDFMKILQQLSKEMEGMSEVGRQRLIGSLFGTYQFSRVNAILHGLEDINDETTQVGRAYKVAQDGASKWGKTASEEMQRIQDSASGKFKRALETVKAKLAEVGEPFLEIGAMILGWVSKAFDMFNGLPGIVKKGLAAFVIGAAILGPIIMLVGLFANLTGHVIKLFAVMGNLIGRFRPMTIEQRAQQMLAERSALAWSNQGRAAQALAGQMQMLTASMERAALAQMQLNGSNITAFGNRTSSSVIGGIGPTAPVGDRYVQMANGRYRDTQTGRFASTREAEAYAAAQAAARRSAEATEESTERTRRDWGQIGMAMAGVAIVGTTMAQASGSSSEMLNNITNMVFMAAMLGPMLIGAFRSSALSSAMASVTAAFGTGRRAGSIAGRGGVGRLASGLSAAVGPARALVMTFMRFAGPAGLLVTGIYLTAKLYGNMKKGIETQKRIGESAKDWADVLGFVYREAGQIETKNGEIVNTLDAQVSKLKEKNEQLVRSLQLAKQNGSQEEAINLAITEGLKLRNHGASAEQAYEAARISLRAAGYGRGEIEEMMVKIRAEVDFANAKDTLDRQMEDFRSYFNKIANNKFGQGKLEGFTRMFSGRGEINNNAAERGKTMAKEFWTGFQSTNNMLSRRKYFDGFFKAVGAEQKEAWGRLGNDNRRDLKKVGIDSWEEFSQAYRDAQDMDDLDFRNKWGKGDIEQAEKVKDALRSLGGETTRYAEKHIDAEKFIAREIAKKNNMSKEEIDDIYTLSDLYGKLDMAVMSTKEAQHAYQQVVNNLSYSQGGITKKEQLRLLNMYRLHAGLSKTKNLEDGFGKATDKSADSVKKNADAMRDAAASADDYNNARQKAMQSAQDYALQEADAIWSERAEEEVSAIEKRGERLEEALDARAEAAEKRFDERGERADKRFDKRSRAMENRWERTMERHERKWEKRIEKEEKAYNKRIDNIKKQIEAEEKAEETRQRIFEAEKTRLERLATIANQRIDFNVALNTGNLDEAAKVFNDIQSTQDSWTLDDAAATSQSSSDKRKGKLEGRIDSIEAARDRRLASLKKLEEAEKKALENKKEREQLALQAERERFQKALEAERERYRKGIEAQRKAIQEQTRRDSEAKRKQLDRAKRTLELELLAVRASIPRNKKEYNKQIRTIEALYRKYGVDLKVQGNRWSETIGNGLTRHIRASARELKNEIDWKNIGGQVTKKMVEGGFGMSTREFMKWVTTGNLPKGYAGPGKKRDKSSGNPYHGSWGTSSYVNNYRHTGGPASGSSKYNNRGGRNMGAGMRQDEIPSILKSDEFVMNGKAHRSLGTDFLDQMNKTGAIPAIGGPMGLTGAFGAAIAGAYKAAANLAVQSAGANAMSFGIDGVGIPGKPGKYGNTFLNAEQLRNAATIIGVGKSMGATTSDLIVSIMTAMQESTLRNLKYGDRDSLGLFQQRPSMGWGTPKQVTTPSYAARKFFNSLLAMKGRHKLPLWEQAQRVQRSAFPYAYAKWTQMARAVVRGTGFEPFAGVSGMGGGRGWRRPVSGGRISQGWSRRHGGIDIAVPTGTAVRAANAGTVTTSRDLRTSYGRYIVIDHGDKTSLYAHLSQRGVGVGRRVGSGQMIGRSGSTGNSTGPHLHFETRGPGGFPGFNPASIVPGLAKGGFTLNDGYAMIHKDETVLTAPLTDQLKSGIQKIDQGVNNRYDVTIDLRGAYIREEIDIEKAVGKALDARENKLGRNRSVK